MATFSSTLVCLSRAVVSLVFCSWASRNIRQDPPWSCPSLEDSFSSFFLLLSLFPPPRFCLLFFPLSLFVFRLSFLSVCLCFSCPYHLVYVKALPLFSLHWPWQGVCAKRLVGVAVFVVNGWNYRRIYYPGALAAWRGGGCVYVCMFLCVWGGGMGLVTDSPRMSSSTHRQTRFLLW